MLNVLLIQLREHADPMAEHEVQCIQRRIGYRQVQLRTRNAYVERADRGWLDGVDALIIGGSGDFSVHHPLSEPWVTGLRHIIEHALEQATPGFGLCFGHQLLAYHLDCEILTSEHHTEIGTAEFRLTELGRSCDLFSTLPSTFNAHTGHSDHVVDTHHMLERIAENDLIDNQAFRVAGTRFYSTQFHPDLTGEEARNRYLAYNHRFKGAVPSLERLRKAERFQPGLDEATALLGRFVDLIL